MVREELENKTLISQKQNEMVVREEKKFNTYKINLRVPINIHLTVISKTEIRKDDKMNSMRYVFRAE